MGSSVAVEGGGCLASGAPAVPSVGVIFSDHAPFVLRSLRRLGVRPADVEDAAQDVFVVVHRNLARYDTSSSLRGWLFGITTRVASDYRRRAHVRREQVTDLPPDGVAPAEQAERLERAEARALLDRALDRLDDRQRAVFILYELEGLAMPEIAELVPCPLQTAYSRLHAARDKVKSFVEAALAEGGRP
ncbi:MAG TPA: sigma-70 family RNA polymerase sigma factor [Polyangiaceae bacterium]|nr:sigma-70 family RNA polymerase sigma factor [Polyangiaceae bacterium]